MADETTEGCAQPCTPLPCLYSPPIQAYLFSLDVAGTVIHAASATIPPFALVGTDLAEDSQSFSVKLDGV
jgi:hypothetical protein